MANRSRLEIVAEQLLKDAGYAFQREFRFNPDRRWRADFLVWKPDNPLHKILVECEGLTRYDIVGHHQNVKGYENDLEKYNSAALDGWTVYRFSGNMVYDDTMIKTLDKHFRR